MKKMIIIASLIIFGFISNSFAYDFPLTNEEYDKYFDFVKSNGADFKQTIAPYKLKFCKNNETNQLMSIFSNQSCLFRYQQGSMIELKKGKKIKQAEFIKSNPDFSEDSNLICLMPYRDESSRHYFDRLYVAFITHTPSNDVYLNSLVSGWKNDYNNKYGLSYIDNNNHKTKFYHQGISTKKGSIGYDFKFLTYHNSTLKEEPWYLGDLYIDNHYRENVEGKLEGAKCYASDDYWNTMFDKEYMVASDEKKEDKVVKVSNTTTSKTINKNKTQNEIKVAKATSIKNNNSQFVTQVLDKQKIKEELTYYKELFEEELIEKSEYDELRKALLAGIKEGSVTKTIIMNKPDNVVINSQNDLSKIQEQLALEKRKVEAMESQAQAAQTTNKIIKEQERKKGWNALMNLGLGIAGGGLSPGGNQRQTNCYDTGSGNFNCTSYDW